MRLTREQILSAHDLKTQDIDIPEWGEGAVVTIRQLPLTLRKRVAESQTDLGEDEASLAAMLCALSVVDEAGVLQFSEDDIQKLREKNPDAISRISRAVVALNYPNREQVERIEKNSSSSQSEDSSTS